MIKYIILLVLGIFFSCSSTPPSTSPGKSVVKKAFSQLENEVSGNQSTGNIEKIITESDELERKKYDTGKPGWIKVSGQRTFDESIAPIKARQQLLQMLRNEAITKKLGAEIEITTLLSDVMSSENVSEMAGMLDREQTPTLNTLDENKVLISF